MAVRASSSGLTAAISSGRFSISASAHGEDIELGAADDETEVLEKAADLVLEITLNLDQKCPARQQRSSLRHIFHIDRLQSRPAASEHRIDWKLVEELEDGREKRVVGPKHHGRADEERIGKRSPDRQFAFTALSDIER